MTNKKEVSHNLFFRTSHGNQSNCRDSSIEDVIILLPSVDGVKKEGTGNFEDGDSS